MQTAHSVKVKGLLGVLNGSVEALAAKQPLSHQSATDEALLLPCNTAYCHHVKQEQCQVCQISYDMSKLHQVQALLYVREDNTYYMT